MSDTKIQVPNSRMEQYLANVLSVLGGSEAVYDPGLPQSREEQYLTAILKLIKEKGSGGEVSGFETITVTDEDIDLDNQTFTLPKTPTDNFILNGLMGSIIMTKDIWGTGYQGYYFMAKGQSITGYLITVTDTSGMYSIVSSAGIDAFMDLVAKFDDYQEKLVSGTNIKTINGQSVLGEGNIDISQEIISCTIDEETGDGTLAKAPTSKSYIIDISGAYLVMNDFGDLNPIQPGDHTYLGYQFANIQPDSNEINIIQFSSKGTRVVIKQVTVPANVAINNYLTIASAESTYAKKTDLNAYVKTADLEKKIPNPPSTNGTYVYKATRTDSGVTFEWVLES